VGVGAQRALPAAAAINWILKDGLGRLGRLSVAARFGNSFDSDLKARRPPLAALPRAACCVVLLCCCVFSKLRAAARAVCVYLCDCRHAVLPFTPPGQPHRTGLSTSVVFSSVQRETAPT